MRFRYSNGTGKLQVIRAGSNLHIYQVQGTYTVILVVSNTGGSGSRSRSVTVTP